MTEKRLTYGIIAQPVDFKEALSIAGETIKQTINKVNQVSIDSYAKVKTKITEKITGSFAKPKDQTALDDIVKGQEDTGVTVKEMTKVFNLSENRTRELLTQLATGGFLVREKEKQTRQWHYYLSDKEFSSIDIEDVEFTDKELDDWIKEQTNGHSKRLEVLDPHEPVI